MQIKLLMCTIRMANMTQKKSIMMKMYIQQKFPTFLWVCKLLQLGKTVNQHLLKLSCVPRDEAIQYPRIHPEGTGIYA